MDNSVPPPREDKIFLYSLLPFASVIIAALILLGIILLDTSLPALKEYGIGLFMRNVWKPREDGPGEYGLLAPIIGTLETAIIAVIIALPMSLSLLILTEEMMPNKWRDLVSTLIDVMAGLPTILYGLWGIEVLIPFLRDHFMSFLHEKIGFIPLLSCQPLSGSSILAAGMLLSIMIIPFIYVIIRESYSTIPQSLVEAAIAYSSGWRHYVKFKIGLIKPALLGGLLLGFGRAAGETVAVALVIGNSFHLSSCIFAPGYTISSLIANQFANSMYYPLMSSVLFAGGLFLLSTGLALNYAGVKLIRRSRKLCQAV
ncbi:MAG: phosphate ABC transporter permease subunit PstC [Desulfurococcales archaeon]|nr:phosphate ABC transporter permease subunit PstC [Desulfurococcales archaeon]